MKALKAQLFTDSEVIKWITWAWGMTVAFLAKYLFDFFKKRNNDLNSLCKRVSKIEDSLIVVRSNGEKQSLSTYVHQLGHKIDNRDAAEAGVVGVLFNDIEEIKKIVKTLSQYDTQNKK